MQQMTTEEFLDAVARSKECSYHNSRRLIHYISYNIGGIVEPEKYLREIVYSLTSKIP